MKKIEEETKQAKKHEGPVLVTDANFKKTVRNNPLVLIDFWDEW